MAGLASRNANNEIPDSPAVDFTRPARYVDNNGRPRKVWGGNGCRLPERAVLCRLPERPARLGQSYRNLRSNALAFDAKVAESNADSADATDIPAAVPSFAAPAEAASTPAHELAAMIAANDAALAFG